MAKIKVRPRPGALSELLKTKGMTQMDANQKTRVDRKTLSKIDRGEEVKLETLQQVATMLRVHEQHFLQPAAAAVSDDEDDFLLPRGTILLRKLDAARLEELLAAATRIDWCLNAQVPEETTRKFLEEFAVAVQHFKEHLHFQEDDGEPPSLKQQLDRHRAADHISAGIDGFSERRLAFLGAQYLLWECIETERGPPEHSWTKWSYFSKNVVLLSIEPLGTVSRRTSVDQGSVPPKSLISIEDGVVFVNGMEWPSLEDPEPPPF